MWRRLSGALVTSPFAFLVAGLYDLGAFWVGFAGASLRRRLRRL